MKCPNCNSSLRSLAYEGITIETCGTCDGEWLDAGELKNIVDAREVRFNEQERQAVAAATKITGVKLDDVDRDLKCPKCGGRTDAINYGGDSGIVIDRCATCRGIWLDRGELERIQTVVEAWEDNLPEELAKYGPRLRQVAAELDAADNVKVSRFAFVNGIINGILDIIT